MNKAVVIGANGQDGGFLVRHLLRKNYTVMGIGRQACSRYVIDFPRFTYYQADLNETGILSEPLAKFRPDLIFHVAAVHTNAGGEYESRFDSMLNVNVGSVHTVLEHARLNSGCRFIYASSAKVFGNPIPAVINESTLKKNQCLYSISKNTAYHLIDFYRKKYGLPASVVYLFNHESEHRPSNFFIPKILDCLASAVRNPEHITEIDTLNFHCDWGSAEEYMDIMVEIVEKRPAEDFVLATGACTFARDLISKLFSDYELKYERNFLERSNSDNLPDGPYKVELEKLKKYLNRSPQIGVYDICKRILAKNHGL